MDKQVAGRLRKLAAAIAADSAAIAKLEEHKGGLVMQLAAAAPWPADFDERDKAFIDFAGIGTVRRVWVAGRRTFNRVKAAERWAIADIDACYDEAAETTRVQFFAERER